jgi:ketosteroid isomerase-like protein
MTNAGTNTPARQLVERFGDPEVISELYDVEYALFARARGGRIYEVHEMLDTLSSRDLFVEARSRG